MSRNVSRCAARSKSRRSVYQLVTEQIIEALERGVVPWRRPWRGEQAAPRSATSDKPYRGVNAFLLAMQADALGLESPYWLTYKQAQALGGQVRRGERSTLITFWTEWTPKEPRGENEAPGKIPVLRYYQVFHASQCDGLGARYTAAPDTPANPFEPIERCEEVVRKIVSGPRIESAGFSACYRPLSDTVRMPAPERFDTPQAYYATLFHELIHSTGHRDRLARAAIVEPQQFGSDPYGREELVAEMGAAFLMGHCGIEATTIDNTASYIDGWLRVIREDARLVIQSAAAAQKAADWVLGRKGGEA
ncbi:zincin-like metallopeptidase domain-containing protein [Aeoliella sp. ICT_H6.2]|uniref:Zincin-like metallopeptidase domain-containing protein n=1 Tax=Aeoliella straminimaris TaxID=2954799 RepID=A0A9X2FC91_9BACT|nr:ArdC-like ssDNA-binding domain-containing protein [Aeoliella straminimaris]MCO6045939.1 zincin-like metallopeptidase domain-containing protein [Aeoliella straminimaris]